MAKKDPKQTAIDIVEKIGGEENIKTYTNCMTRLRVTTKDSGKINIDELKKVQNVLGVNESGTELQIILGPGFVQKVADEVGKNFDITSVSLTSEDEGEDEASLDDMENLDLETITKINKEKQKEKNTSGVQVFLAKFAKIFAPLIFAFIGAGIIGGIAGMIQSFGSYDPITTLWGNPVDESWFNFFQALLNAWKDAFIIVVGWRTAEVFGGTGATGGLMAVLFVPAFAGIVTAPFVPIKNADSIVTGFNFLGIHIKNPGTNWLTLGFRPAYDGAKGWSLSYASGSIIGAMIMALVSIPVEKQIRKIVPPSFDMVFTSVLTFLVLLVVSYFIIIPLSGILFLLISKLFISLYQNAFGAALLAGIFLLAVVFGVHQGFVPVYMIALSETGVNGLFAILAMAGAGQVGVAIALYLKAEKDGKLKNDIKGAIIPGFFGIGEPIIYGITLPRPKAFLAAMLGGAVGGFFLGVLSQFFNINVGLVSMFGPSGLLAIPMMTMVKTGETTTHALAGMGIYLVGIIISYVSGFLFMKLIGTKGMDLS